jgi:hypothetical protein
MVDNKTIETEKMREFNGCLMGEIKDNMTLGIVINFAAIN